MLITRSWPATQPNQERWLTRSDAKHSSPLWYEIKWNVDTSLISKPNVSTWDGTKVLSKSLRPPKRLATLSTSLTGTDKMKTDASTLIFKACTGVHSNERARWNNTMIGDCIMKTLTPNAQTRLTFLFLCRLWIWYCDLGSLSLPPQLQEQKNHAPCLNRLCSYYEDRQDKHAITPRLLLNPMKGDIKIKMLHCEGCTMACTGGVCWPINLLIMFIQLVWT